MLREYETTFIVDAHLPVAQIDGVIEKVTKHIENNGGEVKFIDRWGKRRLAYEIDKKQYGYYVYMRFAAKGSFIKEFEREFKLDDSVLRFLTVLVPKVVLKEEMQRESKRQAVNLDEASENDEASESDAASESVEESSTISSSEPFVEKNIEQGE